MDEQELYEKVMEFNAPDDDVEKTRVPTRQSLILTMKEMMSACITPECVVENYLYADLAQLIAPGGTGKTTLILYEHMRIALGWALWGNKTLKPGWSLIITAEDDRERLIARLREIMENHGLNDEQMQTVMNNVCIWDVTGEQQRLIQIIDGNMVLTNLADDIVNAYKDHPPVLITFDPLVSFGASEARVNDNEQALVTAARSLIKGLKCCVRYIHHTGKGNAREKTTDQYSGRAGSALADGCRMIFVLHVWEEGDKDVTPPSEMKTDGHSSLLYLTRAKMSYSKPNLPMIWIKRTDYQFEHAIELKLSAEQESTVYQEQLLRYLTNELKQGRYYTKNDLEHSLDKLNMKRNELRKSISALVVNGQLVEKELPDDLRQGSRKTYLCPHDLAMVSGEVGGK